MLFRLSSLIIMLFFGVFALWSQPWQEKGLLAYYPFDGDVLDGRGERNDGYAIKFSSVTDRIGEAKKAIHVMGGGVEIYNVNIPQRSATIAIWVKPDRQPDFGKRNILSKHYSYANCELLIRIRPDGYYSAEWNINATYFDISKEEVAHLFKPSFDKFDFLVLRYDGDKAEFFVNNALSARKYIRGEIVNNQKPITVGALSEFTKKEAFYGAVDELRIYNRALSNAEIRLLYENNY